MESGGGANPADPARLAGRLRLGGLDLPLGVREIRVAGTAVPLLEAAYNQATLDAVTALRGLAERDWPYWLEDWPATYALAEALAARAPESLRPPVLDLGCGSGFLAAFFRARFGLPIFSCDFNADACRLAALNARPAAASARDRRGPDPGAAPPPAASRVFCADFARFPSRARFGLVLCGEMLYARENQAPILGFLDRHLAPGGSAWLADPGRSAADGFAERAAAMGFRAGIARMRPEAASGRNVEVYTLTRS